MAEGTIIMTGESVPALLDGRKTQTRRVLGLAGCTVDGRKASQAYWQSLDFSSAVRAMDEPVCALAVDDRRTLRTVLVRPVLSPGDTLWVRETFTVVPATAYAASREEDGTRVPHRVSPDGSEWAVYKSGWVRAAPGILWKSPRFMPRWAARMLLVVERVRFERLQTITGADVLAEGVQIPVNADRKPLIRLTVGHPACKYLPAPCTLPGGHWSDEHLLRAYFASGWDERNARRGHSWEKNDWVAVISFRSSAELECPVCRGSGNVYDGPVGDDYHFECFACEGLGEVTTEGYVGDVEEMLDICEEQADVPKHNGGAGFNQWEREFLESIREQFDSRCRLSSAQVAVLRRLYDRC